MDALIQFARDWKEEPGNKWNRKGRHVGPEVLMRIRSGEEVREI